jgi:transposase-like protein
MKKSFTADTKTAVVLAAFAGQLTNAEISSQYAVQATQIGQWKSVAKQILKDGFSDKRKKHTADNEEKIASLYQLIGKRDAELEWFKKKLAPCGS